MNVEIQETQHLKEVLAVIKQRVASLQRERTRGARELAEYRKYMWEDAALFDRAERVQSQNIALTQERAVLDAAAKLKRLNKLSLTPYFGRIDFRESSLEAECPVYIGLYGLTDDQLDLLIYDWRAPISSMFYDYEVGPAEYEAPEGIIAGDMLLKRQYKIENGLMRYMFDSSLAINDEVLRDALAQNTTAKMRQIVNSIQREQNAVIRSGDTSVLIVQGPAGSGKTSIAMHRAAYLLYRHREHISANNLLIFSPNEVFADYISNVLPELGEENIREATFDDYARSIIGKKTPFETKAEQMEFILAHARDSDYALRTASVAFKSSLECLRILRSYARYLRYTNLRFEDIRLNNVVVMPGSTVKELYWQYCSDLPIIAGIERLKDRVLSRATYSSTIVEKKIEGEIDKVMLQRSPVRLYQDLFKNPILIQKLANDATLPTNLPDICRLTSESLRRKPLLYEDVAPILLLKRLIDSGPRYANIRHLIIDEAQDYTPVHFEIIRHLFGSSSMTILGDLSQRINPYSGIRSYEDLGEVFGVAKQSFVKLTRSYRSSREISEFAESLLAGAESADNVRASGRKPGIVQAVEREQIPKLILAEMDQLRADGFGSVAVICKTAKEARQVYSTLLPKCDIRLMESDSITFHHGQVVLPIYLAKGLEFDAVIIHDAGNLVYDSDTERTLLYTACTRALHSLTLYFSDEPPHLLPMHRQELFEYRCVG